MMVPHLASAVSSKPRIHRTVIKAAPLPVPPFTFFFFLTDWSLQKTIELPGLFSAMGAEESNFQIPSTACRWANSSGMANWKMFSPKELNNTRTIKVLLRLN